MTGPEPSIPTSASAPSAASQHNPAAKRTPHRGLRLVVTYGLLVVVPVLVAVAFLGARDHGVAVAGPHRAAPVDTLARLLLAMVVIVTGAKLAGLLARRLGQPAVIGEIAMGILLGPSVLGAVWPAGAGWLIPKTVLPEINMFAQIGVVLFVFLAGTELNTRKLQGQRSMAVVVSHVGVALPFVLGITVAVAAFSRYAPPRIGLVPFALFMGVSMSITALPVLVRILMDTGLYGTQLGTLALTCSMISDITAWCLLALVVALAVAGSASSFFVTISMVALFIAVLLLVVRPIANRIDTAPSFMAKDGVVVPAALIGLLASALATEWIGVHAIFGAFLFGLVLPADAPWVKRIGDIVRGVTMILLLPLFFVYSGLRTQIGLLGLNATPWLWTGLIVLVAVVGKFAGSAVAARASGTGWRRSLQIGALMNTRGLTELIVLNLGLDLGLLSRTLFTMLVIMALVSTAMAAPIIGWLRSTDQPDTVDVDLADAERMAGELMPPEPALSR
jgi:K+:H+ antiporter